MLRSRITSSADPLARLAVVRCIGEIDANEAVAEILHSLTRLEEGWTYDIIVDLERYEGRISAAHIETFAAAWRTYAMGRDGGRAIAFIAAHPALQVQCLSASAQLNGRDIAAFERFFDGFAWITGRKKARAEQKAS